MPKRAHVSGQRTALWVLLLGFAYGYAFPYFPKIKNPNENVRIQMTAALVEHGQYDIAPIRKRWGSVNDAARVDDALYSVKAPGTSLLGVPGYWLYYRWVSGGGGSPTLEGATIACRWSGTILPWLVFLLAFGRWLGTQTHAPLLRDATLFAVAIGSPLYAYGLLFVSHTLGAAAAFASFMVTFDARLRTAHTTRSAFLAGLFAAGPTFFDYQGLVASVVLAGYALTAVRRPSSLLALVVGGAIPALLVMHFQASAFGSPWTPGHQFLERAYYRELHSEGFYGITGFHAHAALGLLFDLGFGLFPLSPFLLLGVPGVAVAWRRMDIRTEAIVAAAAVVLTWLAVALLGYWRGGWAVGPRFLSVAVPFLAWLALVTLDSVHRHRPRLAHVLAVGTLLAGVLSAGLLSAYYPHIPKEFVRPLPQLVWLLVSHDYAPTNVANLFGVFGAPSMLPLLIGLLACVLATALLAPHRTLWLAVPLAAALLAPQWHVPEGAPKTRAARKEVTKKWHPKGHDRVAVLRARLDTEGGDREEWRELKRLLKQEGRKKEAKKVRVPKSR